MLKGGHVLAGPLNSPYMRLVDGPTPAQGRVAVFSNGQWGGLCSTTVFDGASATVICRQLGYRRGVALAPYAHQFTWYAAWTIYGCTGAESSLLECKGSKRLPNTNQATCPDGNWANLAVSCSSSAGEVASQAINPA
jgi:hypothetical protein